MPALFPVTNLLFRLPLAGRLFMFAIPVVNYVYEPALEPQQCYDWAILDTFDMLSPKYDQPRTQQSQRLPRKVLKDRPVCASFPIVRLHEHGN